VKLEDETSAVIKEQTSTQVIVDNINKFLRNATKEGFWYAVEAVKEYIEVRNSIIDTSGGPDYDDSQQSDKPSEEKQDKPREEKKKKKGSSTL